ncbi:serine/threonine protein kinase [Virgibacillus profundi]|uniref:Serine/threonine-protein kinase PrkC n=1 Tax=Virgibacillus profundi TaxID=2024555 RepID=A0A2A2IFE3_9BACI|nr:Stk1 family PASTA domain-containing Ser/Thr kinase [Virgibacillus profundi]PAV29954.1 serine/threonine protein kinase [Virgibacillus profundi]PXY54126.1 Stk1 family PASTA domain-containing Ser/Thr kinase [Virgibacillus profundi]
MLNGHMLNERYQIKETIGGGGMANVYLATDTILDRDVAIKVMRLEYANDEEFIARFDREAQSASSLSHPNIVNIYDVGDEDNILYMVMEYVDGMTLKEYIQRYSPLDVQEALDIMKQITAAIAHAHANDIVHRDIKPQNILIDTYGQVKVTDFGIAIALSATSLTQTNSILGSVHYLSPEQARGGMATKKSDVYSIGIVLFELLTGRLPFSGQSPVSIALKHLQNDTPSVRRYNQDVPQSVENIVLKATAKDPFHRYETIYDIYDALVTALDPSKMNEEVFTPPVEVGEETKAIPIITDNQLHPNENQDTMVHQTNASTKNFAENEKPKKESKKKKPKKEKKRKKKWIIIFVVIFLLLASGVAALFIIPDLLQPKDVEIPDVIEMDYEDAKEKFELLNLKVEKELTYSDEIEEGKVVRTDPHAGSTRKEESTVDVFVSQGKEKEEFADYVGRDFDQVERILNDAGYSEIIPIEKHSDRPQGEIIRQIQPSPDLEVVPSDTKVIFEVSLGPELISLNNLKGMTEQEAKDYLESKNLKMNLIRDNSESVAQGQVISQEPSSGTELEEGSTVNVYISTGPEEKPPRTHSSKFTVPYNPETEGNEEEQDPGTEVEPIEQIVRIYVKDANNPDISDVFKEDTITEDTEYTITLTIAPGETAEYRVMRDDDVITEETVSYEEGE